MKKLFYVLFFALIISGCSKSNLNSQDTNENPSSFITPTIQAPTMMPTVTETEESLVIPTTQPIQYQYNPYYLPEYGTKFLGNLLDDYQATIEALLQGKTSITLSEAVSQEDFEQLRRAVFNFFVPRNLLYDYQYFEGNGPFSYDEKSRKLKISYEYPTTEYVARLQEYHEFVESIFHQNVSDMKNQFETAKELYLYVVDNTEYVLDRKLNAYDTIMYHQGYCQSYAQMYQVLLWQAGIENYLVATSDPVDHAWNIVKLGDDFYHMDPTWDEGNLYYFGMDDSRCTETGHGNNFHRPCDPLLDTFSYEVNLECTNDQYNNVWLLSNE